MVSVIAAAPLTTVTPANAANNEATTGTESAFVDLVVVVVVEAAVLLVVVVVVVALFVFMVVDWKYRRCPAIIRRQQRDDDDVLIERAINMIMKEVVDGQRRGREKEQKKCRLYYYCLFCLFVLSIL
jgi:hypothetical protein